MDDWWTGLLEGCPDAGGRLVCVDPAGEVPALRAVLCTAVGSEAGWVGLVGSISYSYPGLRYREAGPAFVRRAVQAAAAGAAERGSALLVGGSMEGPQGDFARAFGRLGKPVVHILPCCSGACADLRGILFAEDGQPREREGPWFVGFVGSGFSRRNVALSSLARQYVVVGGGPGTWLEVLTLRAAGAGLLPLICTGGLVEGVAFGGRRLKGLRQALGSRAPRGVPAGAWEVFVGGAAELSPDEYLELVLDVVRRVEVQAEPNNVWPLTRAEQRALEEFACSAAFSQASS